MAHDSERHLPSSEQSPPAELRAQRVVIDGEELLILSHALAGSGSTGDPFAALAPAQREVATLVLEGHSNARIAALRGTSERTVAKQLDTIYRRLGVRSRAELCVLGLKRGRS
jgi:DNA-binding NarL/FixJ family response regulator